MGKTLDRRSSDAEIAPMWKLHDAFETYGVKNWGKGYFGINKLGHVTVHPDKDPERSIDLKVLVDEEVLHFGREHGFGVEAGSKPELLAVLALTNGSGDVPIICNGFKDDEFIKMVVMARKIGKNVIPVVEKFTELELIVKHAEELKVRPVLGVRVKL